MDESVDRPANGRRAQWRSALRRDISRHERRATGRGNFWRYLSLLGSVGWPIVVAGVGGTWLGQMVDVNLGGGRRCTVLLLIIGIALGSWVAWRLVSEERR